MKKLLLVLLTLPLITFANTEEISFNMSTSLGLDENHGQVNLPFLKVNLGKNTLKDFNFTISENDFFIFANDISKIEINNLKTNINSIVLDNKNKKILIELKEEVSGDVEIKGVQIRTYDQEIRDAKIGLDYNNDSEVDLYSTYTVNLEDNGRYSDTMKPVPVLNVQKELTKNLNGTYDINITWEISPDLDIYGSFVKVNKNNNYGNIKEQFIAKTYDQSFVYTNMDLENDFYKIEIYSKDLYYSNTDPFLINLNKDDLIIDEEAIEETVEENAIKIVEKHTPVFVNYYILYEITGIIDNYITKSTFDTFEINKQNEALIIRNEIINILERLDLSQIKQRKQIAEEFKIKFIEFNAVLK